MSGSLPTQAPYDPRALRLSHSEGMADWLVRRGISLAYTSYQTGRLITVGVDPHYRLYFNEQNYTRAMGLHYADGQLYVASLHQIWQLNNMLRPGEYANGAFDCILVPRLAHTTGYVDTHEMSVDGTGRIVFAASRFSCLATVDRNFSFRPIWKPPFISALVAEDRCHLNGLAMEGGTPAYVTALSSTDTAGGWRESRASGGVLIDVRTDEIVTDRLSMPHSPRVRDGVIWALDSGRGYLVRIEPASGGITDVAFCPGFLRGMVLHQGFAIVAVSQPRGSSADLPFQEELKRRGMEPWCGILVVDLARGETIEFIRYESQVTELFDVAALPGVRNPVSVGPL